MKQIEDKGVMTWYPEPFQFYVHTSFKCREYRYVERQDTNFIGDRSRCTHELPVENPSHQDIRYVERQDINIINDWIRNTQDCDVLPVVDSRPQDHRHIERGNTNIIDHRSLKTRAGHQLSVTDSRCQNFRHMNSQDTEIIGSDINTKRPPPLQQVEDWVQMDAPEIQEDTLSQNRRNNIISTHGCQPDI